MSLLPNQPCSGGAEGGAALKGAVRRPRTHPIMRKILIALVVAAAGMAHALSDPYDEAADAKAQIQAALSQVGPTKRSVLVVFGANWCGDCKVLDLAFTEGMSAALIATDYKVVKVNVGRFDRNADIAESYGVPLKSGIPAVAVLSSQGRVVYVTKAGELADARNMGDKGIYEFFSKIAAGASR